MFERKKNLNLHIRIIVKAQIHSIMKKNILTVGLLALSLPAFSQNVPLVHVDSELLYVGKGALLYDGGGMQVRKSNTGTGTVENHGSVMLVGTNQDVFKTIDSSNNNQGVGNTTAGKFINMLNEPTQYAMSNTDEDGTKYSYGQLYITGLSQANIQGVVDQQFRNVNHGSYEQMAFPFYSKTLKSLNDGNELGKTFGTVRRSMDEIEMWDNRNVVFDHFTNLASNTLSNSSNSILPYGYFIFGNKNNTLDVSTVTRTLQGRPFAEVGSVVLKDAGAGINFGTNGNNNNAYNGKYNTYLQDAWEVTVIPGGAAWQGNYGRNIYQFGNPYLTNLDLRALLDPANSNHIANIQGILVEYAPGTINYDPNVGGGSSSARYISWDTATSSFAGDVTWGIVRPMSVFKIKLTANPTNNSTVINFDNLRKFRYLSKASGNGVTDKPTGATLKQLGVIAQDENGVEIGRTYYIVAGHLENGNSSNSKLEVAATSTNIIGTYEEDPVNGGIDQNLTSAYWLYMNEANENTFQGKAVPMMMYSPLIKSLKFEIRENAELIADGSTALSSGIGFYYKGQDGNLQELAQGQVISVSATTDGTEASLYYGRPGGSLGSTNVIKPSRTRVLYNENINNFVVQFDPNWKKANINVFDMSGKLVLSKANVSTSQDFVIELNEKTKNTYVVAVTSENGEKVNAKIIK